MVGGSLKVDEGLECGLKEWLEDLSPTDGATPNGMMGMKSRRSSESDRI